MFRRFAVVKVSNAPSCVPMVFWAIAQKKYVVLGERPEIDALKGLAPEAAGTTVPPLKGARAPNTVLHEPGLTVLKRK